MTFDPVEGDGFRDSILASVTETASVLSRQALGAAEARRMIAASNVKIQHARKALLSAQQDLQRRSVEVEVFEKLLGRLSRRTVPQWYAGPYTPRNAHKTDAFWCRPTAEPPKKQMSQAELDASIERLTDPYSYSAFQSLAPAVSSGGSASDERLPVPKRGTEVMVEDDAITWDTDDKRPWRAGSAPEPKDVFRWSEPLGLPYFDPPTKKISKDALNQSLEKLAQPRWPAPPVKKPANDTEITFEELKNLATATGNQGKTEPWKAGTTHNAPTRELAKVPAKDKDRLPYSVDVTSVVKLAWTQQAAKVDAEPKVQECTIRKPWRVPGVAAAIDPRPLPPVREGSPSVVIRVSHQYTDADFLEGLEMEKSGFNHVTSVACVKKKKALEEWKERKRLAQEAAKATREVALGSPEERAKRAKALRREWAERDARNAARRQARFEATQRARATREVDLGSPEERAKRARALRREWAERDARIAARRQARFEAA